MYTLIASVRSRTIALTEFASLCASMLIAEMFYKFHSFTLECVAFLATWYLFSRLLSLLTRTDT
jgi:hypothetical protein